MSVAMYLRAASMAAVVLMLFASARTVEAAVVLQYHHVSDSTPRATSISPALFREHMKYIEAAGFAVRPLEDLTRALAAGDTLPDKTVAITFDDGYESVYTEAFPVLREYGWPFTVFVNSRPLDQRLTQFVSWEQLREMAQAGATIANHSWTHPHMVRRAPGESETQWRKRMSAEILQTEERITEATGQAHQIFAYPYGEYDTATQALLAELGFVAFAQQSGPLAPIDDPQALPRFPFGGPYGTLSDFKVKVGTLPMPLEKVEVLGDGRSIADTLLPQSVNRPELRLTFGDAGTARRVQCFASGQGAIPLKVDGRTVIARAAESLPVGRSRYNCTAASGEAGRYHWYSRAFIRKKADGQWYEEQ